MITRREELMCVQSIFMGGIPIIGEGLNEVIDFHLNDCKEVVFHVQQALHLLMVHK